MTTISLKPDLADQVEFLTSKSQTSTEAFVDKALRAYLSFAVKKFVQRPTPLTNSAKNY